MKKILALLVWLTCGLPVLLLAKDPKPTLLVYGAGIEAFTAAIQAARSNVPTVWVVNSDPSFHHHTSARIGIQANDHLDSGIWRELLSKIAGEDKPNDSLAMIIKKDINLRLLNNVMDDLAAQVPALTIVRNMDIRALDRGRNSWQVTLQSRVRHQVRAIVDASIDGRLAKLADDKAPAPVKLRPIGELSDAQVRTVVAIGDWNDETYAVTTADILAQQTDNVFRVYPFMHVLSNSRVTAADDTDGIPLRAQISQAIGAAAAYCAFFKTAAQNIDLRKLQTELMSFHVKLFPWKNIRTDDPNFMAVQKAYLASIFGTDSDYGSNIFLRDTPVYVDSVRTIFNQYYSRSQLWFLDQADRPFTLRDALALIKVVAFRGDEVDAEVEKGWTTRLHFEGEYDPDRILTKYEFAALIDRYANPFAKTVTAEGNILR